KQIKGYPSRLFKNLGNWKFRDVTTEVGLDGPLFYTHGCAVADYNCDGWPDLLVTGWGRIVLYENQPDGKGGRRFVDVTEKAGLAEKLWSTSAGWADLDGDGFPDLYVCQYVNWSFENNPKCPGNISSVPRDVCPPRAFAGLSHKLYRNNRDGTFVDVSREARVRPHTGESDKDVEPGKGLGVLLIDIDDDGKPDIYVANDTVDNFLYRNRSTKGKLEFEEIGMVSGVARDDRGVANGSMGVDGADYDDSGRPSLWVTNYENELHALYRNQGNRQFFFSTSTSGIAAIGQKYVGFGTAFLDIDNHGWEDLVIANGHAIRYPASGKAPERPVLLRNVGQGRFVDITPQGGSYFRNDHLGRGLVAADLDNDGRPDLVVSHVNEPVVVLQNEADCGNHWIGIELAGKNHHDVVGTKVIAEVGSRRLTRFVKGGGSYCSSPDPRLLFGLGKAEKIDRLTVVWPSRQEQHFSGDKLTADRYWLLSEGNG